MKEEESGAKEGGGRVQLASRAESFVGLGRLKRLGGLVRLDGVADRHRRAHIQAYSGDKRKMT
jgi:hypothetical protein